MDIKGAEKMTAVYWFAILLVVAGAIAYMVFVFYGKPYGVANAESRILGNKIADCLSEGGYLNEEIVWGLNNDNFLDRCNINFETEDVFDWKDKGQYYAEVNIYNFNQNLGEGYAGELISKVVAGNKNLKPIVSEVEGAYDKDTIVIHYTAGGGTYKGVESVLKGRGLSVQYILQKDGKVAECELDKWRLVECTLKDVSEVTGEWEKNSAQHAGCGSGASELSDCSDDCINGGLLTPHCNKGICCINGFNQRGIGIEIINRGPCGEIESCLENGIDIDGKIWDRYTDEQMNSLIELVAGIAERNNILVDGYHIIGHQNITNNKGDPGPALDWNRLMEGVSEISSQEISLGTNKLSSGRRFYVLDRSNNKYVIEILANVGKSEKNE